MYGTRVCPYCRLAEALLQRKGVKVEKIMVDEDPVRREEMIQRTGCRMVPQIFIGTTHVGGYTDIAELEHRGELDALLAQS